MKYSDVDFARHTIAIQRQVSTIKDDTKTDNKSYYGLKCLKSESSNRVLSTKNPANYTFTRSYWRRRRDSNHKQSAKILYLRAFRTYRVFFV